MVAGHLQACWTATRVGHTTGTVPVVALKADVA